MAQASTHSSNADSVLSPIDKDSLSVPEGDDSAQTQADPTSKKPSDETTVHNAQALNDIIESAPANDVIPYFIHINGIKGLGTIATSPELATPAPYEQTPVRIHNQFIKQGTISPCDVALIETGSALANARTTSKLLAHSELLAALIPNNVYQSCDPNDIEWNQLVCLKLHQITAKDIERTRALAKAHKCKKGARQNQAKHQLKLFLTLGVGAWHYTYIKLKQIKSCRKDDVIIVLPIAALKLANKTITAVKEQHPELLSQPWSAEVEERLYQEYQKLEANQATPQGEAEVRSRRVPQTGQFGRYDPQISAAQGIGVGLAASCALIEDVCAYYQPDSAKPVTVHSSATSPKADQKSDAAGTNDQGNSENEASQQSSELQDVADVNLKLNIKRRLAFRFSISLPADYLKCKEKRQQAIINHSYNHDTKRAEAYCQQLFDGALAYYERKVNAQLVPLKTPTEVQLYEDALPYMVVLGLMLSAQCADLVTTLPVFKKLAPKTERVLNEHKAQKKKAKKNKAKDDSAVNATSIDTSVVPDFAQADGAKFNQIRDMLQSGCVELLGRLNQLYEPLVPCAGLNREIIAAHDLLREWQQPLEAKLEQQQDATKPIHNAASLKASFSAQLLRIEAEAHKLPSAMRRPICAVVKLLAALPLEREELLSVDALRTLTLGFLELTHDLSCAPLLQLQAPAQAKALSAVARSLEYMRARAKIWPFLHEPSQILDFALNLSTDCQYEAHLLEHPYYEPQGQCLPVWSKQVFKALSKSELLLQRLTMLNQHASKDELAVVSAANSLLDLCRNAYQQASKHPDTTPHLLTQLAALYEQATQVLAPLQQDQMQLSQVVALCAQLYALGQELQRKLARKDEPCALITSLETTCYTQPI